MASKIPTNFSRHTERTTIRSITVEPLDIPLLEPFSIATGSVSSARNVLITITLNDGSVGYGEAAPFPPSTGETQETALAAAHVCVEMLIGQDAAQWRNLSHLLHSIYYSQGTVCAAFEIALLDALTRSFGMPLYTFFGGASTTIETDISIPLVAPAHAERLALEIVRQGVKTIKVKVGGDLHDDVDRVEAVRVAAPNAAIMLDANQGYTPNEALLCLEALDDNDIRPILMEQPVHKDDFEGLRYVTQHTRVPVCADESASSPAAVARLIAMGAVNAINIKLMKRGILGAMEIAAICHATNTQLMVGAMMESRVATSAAAHFVAGTGGFRYIDLDTPLLLADDPFIGGYEQYGGTYDVSNVVSGLGVERKPVGA